MKEIHELFSVKAIKDFKELTHLTIGSPYSSPVVINETVLTDIDLYLPRLHSFTIYGFLKASQWTADILSRLSALEALDISVWDEAIRHIIEAKVNENCKKIKCLKT